MTRGVNTGRGVKRGRVVGKAQGPKVDEGYVEYLKSMKGRNKTVPLTPEQFKKHKKL